jgi:hypothetical protein
MTDRVEVIALLLVPAETAEPDDIIRRGSQPDLSRPLTRSRSVSPALRAAPAGMTDRNADAKNLHSWTSY